MIRQTKNYLVGALSGVTLIGISIAAFVVIVSAQVFHEFPIADTGTNVAKGSLAPAKALGSPGSESFGGATAVTGANPVLRADRAAGRNAGGAADEGTTTGAERDRVGSGDRDSSSGNSAGTRGDETSSSSSSGGDGPSRTSSPSSTPGTSSGGGSPSSSASPAPPNAGGNSAAAASTGAGPTSNPTQGTTGAAGSTGSGGTAGDTPPSSGGGPTVETPVTAAKVPPVSEAVNETVHEVDQGALGGTLEKTGVTEVTAPVVEGVTGPETPVGKTVEGATEAVGGLLGGGQ